jgi:hypothetical protein
MELVPVTLICTKYNPSAIPVAAVLIIAGVPDVVIEKFPFEFWGIDQVVLVSENPRPSYPVNVAFVTARVGCNALWHCTTSEREELSEKATLLPLSGNLPAMKGSGECAVKTPARALFNWEGRTPRRAASGRN